MSKPRSEHYERYGRGPVRGPVRVAGDATEGAVGGAREVAGGAVEVAGGAVDTVLAPFGGRRGRERAEERRERRKQRRQTRRNRREGRRTSRHERMGSRTEDVESRAIDFEFEPIDYRAGRKGEFNFAWLKAPRYDDWVLIKYKGARPEITTDGGKNFCFVSPNDPMKGLPEGLYYWQSSNQLDIPEELHTHRVDVAFSNKPGSGKFRYVGGDELRQL